MVGVTGEASDQKYLTAYIKRFVDTSFFSSVNSKIFMYSKTALDPKVQQFCEYSLDRTNLQCIDSTLDNDE